MNRWQYTAPMIARALGITAKAVRDRLSSVVPSGSCIVAGQPTRCYRLEDFSAKLGEDLFKVWRAAEAATGGRTWRDLAHFLSDPPPPAPASSTADSAPARRASPGAGQGSGFDALNLAVSVLGDPANPTPGEEANLWHLVFTAFEAAGKARRVTFKRATDRWIAAAAPFLAVSRRTFNRKLAEWRQGGRTPAAMLDRRPKANAARSALACMPKQDQERLLACAIKCHGGEIAPAFRELAALAPEHGGFSAGTRYKYHTLPRSVRRLVAGQSRQLYAFQHQPRKAGLNAAYLNRDWSGVAAGDWFSSDDFTLEVYFYVPDGKGWYTLTRGQFLPMIDERSLCILDALLIPEGHYTGANIRTLINRVGLRFGLPRIGFHFERGIWKKSGLVGGAVPWGEVETKLADRLGIRFEHSRPGNAKAKPVEGVGKLLQRRLRRHPGWVGPNEQVFKVEPVQKAMKALGSNRMTPWDAGFKSFEEWGSTLAAECVAYNRTPQRSRIMGGNQVLRMTPEEAWRLLQPKGSPLVNLRGSGAEHLLTHHARQVKVTRNGIRFQHAGQSLAFASEVTGQLVGQTVNVYHDAEAPEVIHIETASGDLFHVERQPTLPAHDATPEQFRAAAESAGAHNREMRARVLNLPHDFMPPTRINLPDPALTRRQDAIAGAEAAQKGERMRESRAASRVAALAQRMGAAVTTLDAPPLAQVEEALKLRESALSADEHD